MASSSHPHELGEFLKARRSELPPITFFVAPQWGSRPLELA
ncbi:hypothetical protein ACH4C2_37960 [Streptomyces sp. NPDC018057]